VGGFDLGFELAGVETVAQCEIDDHARVVLAHHWPEVTRYHDITKLDGRDLRGVDVITGGFPCQDLSVAGKRKGLSGARSGLFFQLARVVEEARPRLLVWENVPGLLSQDRGGAMREVVGELARIGYFGAWRVLDSQFHGIPQRRRRVFGAFAPGSAGGWACGAAVLLEREGGGWAPAEGGEAGEDVATTLSGNARGGRGGGGYRRSPEDTYVVNLDATPKTSENIAMTLRPGGQGRRQAGGTQYVTGFTPAWCSRRAQQSPFDASSAPVGTLQADTGATGDNLPCVTLQEGVRRLTPLEYERLQGFPDGWTDVEGMSDTQRYRQLGNAVSVPVAYWIGLRAKMALEAGA
jgi:DNA (cytosine-5)-methyltransferase 1